MLVVIIDDETSAQENLLNILSELAPHFTIAAVVNNVAEGVKSIHKHKPDIVFSDIDMPGITGLQLLEFFNPEEVNFELIYITNFSEYAVKAFQLSAIDYLLKPIDKDLLMKAIQKVDKKLNFGQRERNQVLRNSLIENNFSKIALPLSDGVVFIEISEILYLEADNVYTYVNTKNGKRILVSKPLKSFEKLLIDASFFRIHRSFLVNVHEIKQFIKSDGGSAVMENDVHLPIARDRKEAFTKVWEQIRVR